MVLSRRNRCVHELATILPVPTPFLLSLRASASSVHFVFSLTSRCPDTCASKAMLKGSTMDDSTLREFLHVLSLDYKASKTERITATLSAVTRSVGATAASKTTTEPDAALGYEKDGVGLAQEGGPHSPAAAPTYSGEMLDATGATERGLPSPPTQDLSTSTISAAAQTTGCIDAVDGRATVRDRNVGSGSGDGGECVGAATISSTELDMSPANTRTDEFSGNFGSIAEAGTAIGKVSISGGGW